MSLTHYKAKHGAMHQSEGTRTTVKSTKLDVGELPGHFENPERSLI